MRDWQALNIWFFLGVIFLGIGSLGVFLPLLPTTPFVLVSAGCFARSSPRMHNWLLNSQLFGPMIADWNQNKCVSVKVKVLALSMIILVGGASVIFFVPSGWPQIAATGLITVGAVVVLSLKTCAADEC